jgi:hypothetical protein
LNAADHTSGRRALHEAAEEGHLEIVKLLLIHGAEVNVRDKWAQTPLHRAFFCRQPRVVEVLLRHGADVEHIKGNIEDIGFWDTTPKPMRKNIWEILSKKLPGSSKLELVKEKWLKRDDENPSNRGCPDIVLEPPDEI